MTDDEIRQKFAAMIEGADDCTRRALLRLLDVFIEVGAGLTFSNANDGSISVASTAKGGPAFELWAKAGRRIKAPYADANLLQRMVDLFGQPDQTTSASQNWPAFVPLNALDERKISQFRQLCETVVAPKN